MLFKNPRVCFYSKIIKSPQVVVAVANGSEEMEAVTIIDALRRAEAQVTVAKVQGQEEESGVLLCHMSRGV